MATGKEIRDRVFAMSGAILFFVTACALTIAVIVTSIQDSKKGGETPSNQQVKTDGEKLEGTKLAEFTPVPDVAEVSTTDLTAGTGKEVTSVDNTVTADYTGALAATGVIFQSSLDTGEPFKTQLSGVIKGWQTGMIGMKEGGKRRILIPAAQAYGEQSTGNIPANSDLVFDITLHKVQ